MIKNPMLPRSPKKKADLEELQKWAEADAKAMKSMLADLKSQLNWLVITAAPTETPIRVPTMKLMDDGAGDEALYIYFKNSWKKFSAGAVGGFPSGTKMWFYQAAAPTGWTIDNTLGDKVLAVHGTSAYAGSTQGGQQKGTWTQPNHTHTGPSHRHTISHTHHMATYGNTAKLAQSYIQINAGYFKRDTGTSGSDPRVYDHTGGSSATYSGYQGTGATGGGATANTWRPYANVGIIATKD